MAMVIEITENDLEEMGQHVGKMLHHGGRLMSCIEKLKCDDMGYRNDRYSMGNRGGSPRHGGMGYRDDDEEEDEYANGMGMRRMRDSRGRYM